MSNDAVARLASLDHKVREGLLDLMWAAWFASRPHGLQQLISRGLAGDEMSSLQAAQSTIGDDFKLRKLGDQLAGSSGHEDAQQAIVGLLEGSMIMHLPPRLQRVVIANDADRLRLADLVREGLSGKLHPETASDLSATLGFLVEAQPTTELTVLQRHAMPAFVRDVLSSLGMPSDSYEATVEEWVRLASQKGQ